MSTSSKSTQVLGLSVRWWLGGLLLIAFLALGLSTILLQKQLRQDQESRSQASLPTGTVLVANGTSLINSGTTSQLNLTINTQSAMLGELALNFDVLLPSSVTTIPSATNQPQLSMQGAILQSSAVGVIATPLASGQRGWRVSLVATPINPTSGFGGTTAQPLLRLDLPIPVVSGQQQLQVKFDNTTSHAYAILPAGMKRPTVDILAITPDIMIPISIPQSACTFTYSAWSACQNGQQTRSFTAQPAGCGMPDPSLLIRTCLPQCHYTYSNWGSCVNGWQTRTYTQTPAACTWYQTETLQPLTQSCATNTSNSDFSVYTYESCWSTQSPGNTTYVMWNKTKFPGVAKVDVSTNSDFSTFGNKDVANATSTFGANYLVTDGTNFRTYTDGQQQLWVFWPGYTYYFRLFYENGQHSPVISYFVPKCAGTSTVSYKLCNETCANNAECSPNLACVSGQCRRANNPSSNVCATPPDQGLKRACNDYCADSTECASGLTCWWNRCRLPKNLDNTSCRTATVTRRVVVVAGSSAASSPQKGADDGTDYNYVPVGNGIAESACNGSCASNRDCAANLRCYRQTCRLPENVTNTSCLTVAAEEASTRSATVSPTVEPTLIPLVTQPPSSFSDWTSWFSEAGQWFAGRLSFLIVGLVIAIVVILVWPMLRTGFTPVQRSKPTAYNAPSVPPRPSTSPVRPVVQQTVVTRPATAQQPATGNTQPMRQPVNQAMTPPPSAMTSAPMRPTPQLSNQPQAASSQPPTSQSQPRPPQG